MKQKLLFFLIAGFLFFNKQTTAQTFAGTTGAVPDLATTCFTANVVGLVGTLNPANGLITCCINLTHTYDADLTINLTAPSGASILLTSNNGGAGDNYITTCFDGNVLNSVTTGVAPFNGSYRPEGSMNCVNNGTSGNGVWTLCITDGFGGDVGFLNSWNLSFGATGIPCTNPTANDNCLAATPICNLNGYCGSTSSCYTASQVPAGFCGSVENNSWLSFVASATSATFDITVGNCLNSQGIQMEVYSTTNCVSFTSFSNCWNPGVETNGTITATPLVIGNTYYLMIDGYAGDVCDYSISATAGVLTVSASASPATICQGSSTTLTATATGATSYSWAPGGGTTASIVVSPASTTTYTVTISGTCGASQTATTTVTVNTPATVNAGADQIICSGTTATMAGSFGGGATSATWSTSGSGSFSSATSTTSVYTPSAADIAAGTVTITYTTNDPAGPCPAVNDAMVLAINPAATVSAAADQTICSGSTATLGGSMGGGATTVTWTTSGTGTFSNSAILNPVYTPSAADIAAGTVTLTITTNNPAGPCNAVTDFMILTISLPAGANAGPPTAIICAGSTYSTAGASFSGSATSSTWTTSGSGTFASASTPVTTYTPSAADIASGTVTLTITTNDPAGPCPATSDFITLTINPAATAAAGANQTICSGNTVTLTGSIGGSATTSTWTTSGTGTFANASLVNTTYTPSAADIAAGTVTLTITTNDPAGPCPAATSSLVVTINPAATANANVDATICAGSTYTLAGSIGGGATTLTWTTSGSGSFSSSSSATATYTPSASDISAGTVTLTITTNDPAGPCPAATDNMVLTISPAATATAGANQTICSGSTVTLSGSIGGSATTSTWTTSGTGTFANATLVNTTYTPSAADIAAGTVTLTITTNDPAGPCPAATSSLVVTINPAATANANVDATICAGSTYTLAGSIGGGATTLTWTTSGSGSFSSSTSATATYTPSAADIAAGTVTLTITTNDPAGPCGVATDNMVLTISPGATASAGPAATICAGTTYSVPGSIGGSATTVTWTSSGTGTFSSTTSVTPTYTPSAADIAAGTVTLTITTNDPAGPCPAATSNMVLTINPAPTVNAGPATATICANQTLTLAGSQGGATTSVTWTSSGSGTFSSTTSLTPVYTPSASDIAAGTVTLTITSNDPAGPCGPVSDVLVLTITPLQNAAFTFGSATYCQTGANPTPTVTGVAGGTFTSSPAGLSINAATGTINLAASALGTYTVTYTTPGPCPNSSNVSVTITLAPTATFSYSGPYCTSGADPFPTFSGGATAGTFSAVPAGLTFVNVNTGQIDVSATTPGTYTVTNTIVASGGCAAASANNTVTINAEATANAGAAATICAGSTYTLAGSIGGSATTLTWTTSGTGTFSLATSATAVYTPSAADIAAGTVTLTLTTNDPAGPCPFVTSTMVLTINPAATAAAGSAATICAGSTYTLAGAIGGSAVSSTWTTSGTGTFNNAALLGAIYTPSAADISAGTVTLTLTTNDPAGPCPAATSSLVLTINPIPTVTAGANATICSGSTYTLAGTMGGGATSITWTTSGSGTFSSATSLTATYTPSAADIAAGTVTLTITTNDPAGPCTSATASMVLTINPAATVSAGAAATICAGSTYTLSGSIGGGATSSTWTTSGTGTFNNAALLGAIYTPSAADISAGTVTLTLTTNDPAGPCPAATSSLVLTINPIPTVTAGANATICSGSTYTLAGTMGGGATSITWTTSGSGTFSSATSLTATYTPSAADIAAGTVTLTITTNDPAGPCTSATASMVLTINPAATVSAGAAATICAGSTYSLSGTMGGGATSITWSTSGTGTFNNTASTTAIYTPSAADVSAGTVTLTITSNDPAGPCPAATATMVLTINPAATVVAGANATICAGSTYTLAGSMGGGATSITWTTSGTGTFSLATSTTATYTPSAADISFGSVTLTITTNDPAGPCPAVVDFLTLTINPAAVVTAGAAASICAGSTYTLAGTMGGSATLVTWTTSGTGTFSNPNITTPIYTPSAADITAGTVTLTITSNDPVGPCGVVTSNMVLTISPAATVSAGGNATICSSGTYTLAGTMGGSATSITWTTTGSGTFSSATSPTAVYTPSAGDIAAGSVTLTITTNNPAGPCNAATDVMTLTINPAATVNAGPDNVICSNVTANLVGSFGGSASGVTWTTSGTGTFGSSTSASTTYSPSAADITAGTVTLTITSNDPAGVCGAVTDVMVLTINPQDNASFSYPSSTFCQTGTDPVATITGGATGTFVATPAGIVFIDATTGLIDVSASALGNYFITFNTSGICPNNSTISVTVTAAPNATMSYGTPFCQNGTAFPTFGAGASAGVFSATPAGLVFVSTSTGEIDLAASAAGTYTITNAIAAASGCAAASANTTVVIDPIPTVTAGIDGTICEGSAYSLSATMGGSASSITWTTSGSGTFSNTTSLTSTYTPSAADVSAGSVILTITTNDPAGVCTQITDIMTLTITPLDLATFNYTGSTFCQTGTNPIPTVTGLAGGTFSATPAGLVFVSTATGEINLAGSTLGTYDIIYTTNGVCPNTDTVSITITNAPSAVFSYSTPFCQTDADPFPTFPVGASGGVFSSTVGLVFVSTSTGEIDMSLSTPGTYTITNSIAAGGGCAAATANTIIVIDPSATANAGADGVICAGSTYTITGAAIGGSATTSTWTTSGSGTFDNTALLGATYTPSLADTTAGTVTLYLTTNDPAGACGAVLDSLVITINNTPPAPTATNPPAACFGSPISPISVTTSGSVTWYADAGLTSLVGTANPYTPTVSVTTNFWVTGTIGACQGPATMVTVTINPLPVADTSLVSIVDADCGTLTGSVSGITIVSGTSPFSYIWINASSSDTLLNLTNVGPGSYFLTVTDSNGCSITLGGLTGFVVNSSSNVVASFNTDTTSGETPLTVNFTNTSTGATSYFWTFGTGDTSTVFSPTYIYTPLGQFTPCLIATNAAGCADTACTTIDVFINSVFIIPNVFTPNGDNNNDVFTVQAIGLETMDAEIYNRWGQKEFEWHTTNGGWDGRTASGVEAPDGTYYYLIKAKGFDDKEYFEKGYFMLTR